MKKMIQSYKYTRDFVETRKRYNHIRTQDFVDKMVL